MKTLKEIIVEEYANPDRNEKTIEDFADTVVSEYEKQKDMPKCIGDKCQDCVFDADCKDKQKLEPIEKSFQPYGVVYVENFFSVYSAICLINNKLNEVIDRINKMEAK